MFLSLSIKNSFLPSDSYIEFEEGLNVIVGKNNSGKSTTIEMLNFILFGSSALRSLCLVEIQPSFLQWQQLCWQ